MAGELSLSILVGVWFLHPKEPLFAVKRQQIYATGAVKRMSEQMK
jgi:hypothetical protein